MPEDVNEESSDLEKTVPYSRFKDVNEAKNKAEQDLQAFRAGGTNPDQDKEARAKTFLKGLVKEQLQEEEEAKKAFETQKQKEFKGSVDEVLAVNTSIDKQVFLKFIKENSDKYTITTVKGAMKLYKDLNKIKDDTVEETKDNLSKKPNLPKSRGTSDTKTDYSDDKDKSYNQVVQEIIEESEEQGRK